MSDPGSEEIEDNRRYRKNYDQRVLCHALHLVKYQKKSAHKAAQETGIPYSTLRRYVKKEEDFIRKMGRPYTLSSTLELRLYNYIVEMTELGFGITVLKARKYVYDLFKEAGRRKLLPSENRVASIWWWNNFKFRYGFCLSVPESLSAFRSYSYCKTMVVEFFKKLDELLTKLFIKDKPHLIWNCDNTGLAYVVKQSVCTTGIGKKYAYRPKCLEEGETQTLLVCIGGDGSVIPPMITFKGEFWYDLLKTNALPNALVNLSPKGWIDNHLFFEWLRFFISSIKPERPVVLLMESHSAHIGADVLKLAKDNHIYICTFPVHCTYLLQPLDVLLKPLNHSWQKNMTQYMSDNPLDPPSHSNFHTIFNPAFVSTFTSTNIKEAFNKTGIYPMNADAIPDEKMVPSVIMDIIDTPQPESSTKQESRDDITGKSTKVDDDFQTSRTSNGAKDIDYAPQCFTPIGFEKRAIYESEPSGSTAKSIKEDDEWRCGYCDRSYSGDIRKKKGAKWIQCSYCLIPYHKKCVSVTNAELIEQLLYFRCNNCM